MRCLLRCLPFALAACTQFPDLDGATSALAEAAEYPALVPLDPLLRQRVPPAADVAAPQNLSARAEALRARAARLRGRPVIDGNTRARMARGAG